MNKKEEEVEDKNSKDKFANPKFTHAELRKTDSRWGFVLEWRAEGIGFGEFTFYYDRDENKFSPEPRAKMICDNEYMSKEFVKKALCAMVDNCTCIDERVAEDG